MLIPSSDDPAAKYVRTRPINPYVGGSASYDTARKWLQDCLENHHIKCPVNRSVSPPRRLIELEESNTKPLKVYLRHPGQDESPPYAALSYCWGDDQPFNLNSKTLDYMQNGFDLRELPQTLQDAIIVTWRLNLRFIWIDALCILQDSVADKDIEISKMSQVYGNATTTIYAAYAARCDEGFLDTRSFEGDGRPCAKSSKIDFPCPGGELGHLIVRKRELYNPIVEALENRAWALQERTLSPRVLAYGAWQVWWKCRSALRCDGGTVDNFVGNGAELVSLAGALDQEWSWEVWESLVSDYSRRGLSVPSDKLPALSAIASRFQENIHDDYCAGLWRSKLTRGLRWYAEEPDLFRPEEYRAPTWSWASVFGEVQFPRIPGDARKFNIERHQPEIIECKVTLANPANPFGRVTDGKLRMKGVAKKLNWNGAHRIFKEGFDQSAVSKDSLTYFMSTIATVYPDCQAQKLYNTNDETPKCDSPPQETIFWMGIDEEDAFMTRPITCIALDGHLAIMLEEVDDGMYARIGLMMFDYSNEMKMYFEGCQVFEVVIR